MSIYPSMMTRFGTFEIYYVFENIMENGTLILLQVKIHVLRKMEHLLLEANASFSILFSKVFKILLKILLIFCKNVV